MVMRRCLNVKKISFSIYDNMELLLLNCLKVFIFLSVY